MKIKAVFYDVGGTLIEPQPSVGAIYSHIAAEYGMTAAPEIIERLFSEEYSRCEGLRYLITSSPSEEKEWWKEMVESIFRHVTDIRNFDQFFDDLYEYFVSAQSWHVYPDTISVMSDLKNRGLHQGVISNWDSRLTRLCGNLGLTEYLDFILASSPAGFAKPSPEIFKRALQLAEVNASEAIHIGDSIENDYAGAAGVGIAALIIDRNHRYEPAAYPAVTFISTLDEVEKYLL